MEVVYECCCGLDVHAKTVVACLVTKGRKEIRTFATMTEELLQLGDWLRSAGCTHVAIESTGVYWKPVFNSLMEVSHSFDECDVKSFERCGSTVLPGWLAGISEGGP